MNMVASRPERSLDPWLAPAAVVVLGCGTVVLLVGLGAGDLPFMVLGLTAGALSLLVLIAGRWLDGLSLLAASLPLPALFSSESLRLAPAAVVTFLVLLAWLLNAARHPPTRVDLGRLPRRSALGLLAAVVLSSFFAAHMLPAVRELLNFGLLLALLVVATVELRRSPRHVHGLARVLAGGAGVAGGLGVLEALGVLPGRFPLSGTTFQRATFGFGWPNEFGIFMAISLPVVVHVYGTAGTRSGKLWAGGALGFAILGLAATFSRGSWLALVAAAPILLFAGERRFVVRILLFTVAVLILDIAVGGALNERITSTLRDPYVVQRLALTVTGILMFLAHPLVGVGPGGFDENLTEFGPQVPWLWDYVGTAHNAYVDMAAETGAIGLVALIAFLGTLLIRLLSSVRTASVNSSEAVIDDSLRKALLWSFAVACAAGFTVWPFAHGVGQLVMLIAAMGIALDGRRVEQP